LSHGKGHRATNSVYEVRLLAGRLRGERRDASWSVKPSPSGLWVRFPGTPPITRAPIGLLAPGCLARFTRFNAPAPRGARSLGERRSDMPVQASSILAPRTASTWRNRQTQPAQTRPSGGVLGRFAPCARSAVALCAPSFATNPLVDSRLSKNHVTVAERHTRQAENLCPNGYVSSTLTGDTSISEHARVA
jgi:hypothetical protein